MDNVAVWLLKKSEPQYYKDTVVKNGYFKGKESVAFVSEVLDRYEHYKNIIPLDYEPVTYMPKGYSINYSLVGSPLIIIVCLIY